jgi:hypothetical protein
MFCDDGAPLDWGPDRPQLASLITVTRLPEGSAPAAGIARYRGRRVAEPTMFG